MTFPQLVSIYRKRNCNSRQNAICAGYARCFGRKRPSPVPHLSAPSFERFLTQIGLPYFIALIVPAASHQNQLGAVMAWRTSFVRQFNQKPADSGIAPESQLERFGINRILTPGPLKKSYERSSL
jgi:hypothetical protein